jgi:Fe-S-cluster-containing dehydrogenase component
MARLAMLIDLTRCIGCDACTVACKQENGTPADVFFARVLNVEAGSYPDVKRMYIPVLCNHCENPACLKACPNKAIFRRDDGIVLIDQKRCRGTGACVSACPYGNIILTKSDKWYLKDDQPYERDFVKPRLEVNKARKCTLCAQRVDQGLEPACVVACPTTARIFGDKDDPESKISRYVEEQKDLTDREPFRLLPEAGTDPANLYLGTMAVQESSVESRKSAVGNGKTRAAKAVGAVLLAGLLLMWGGRAVAQRPAVAAPDSGADIWRESTCAGCHGQTAMGGFGPPLAETKLTLGEVRTLVRKGKGMMPAVPEKDASAAEVAAIHAFVRSTKLDPSQIPISYKVGALLSVKNVGIGFSVIGTVSLLLALRVILIWLRRAGWPQLRPYVARFGYVKATGVALKAFVVDGLLVASLWRKSPFRWAMHGLLLYGFIAIGLADMLMSIFNPLRTGLPPMHPFKLMANLGGIAILAGVVYVRYRYMKDEFIDNGLTLGQDYLFLNLLTLAIITGFITQALRSGGAIQWVMPVYIVHLGVIATLLVSAPYTRFSHVFVVPVLVALTKVTEAITESGVDLGFAYEPSPGRHHKSERIARGVVNQVIPDFDGAVNLRYYP